MGAIDEAHGASSSDQTSASGAPAAHDVDTPASSPNEIVVTATRRAESVLSVPLSVSAYNQESLDTKGVRSVQDLARVTPGVNFSQASFGKTDIAIRGITSTVGAATTGIYIDDTPVQVRSISLQSNFYPAVFDLERIEVLRGPQGTLFGAGAEGGAVRYILPKPSLTKFSGYGRAEIATTEGGAASFEGGAAVGGPLVENRIGFRASAYHRRDGGYIDRIPNTPGFGSAEKNSNARDTTVANFSLALAPSDRLTITPSVFYQRIKQHDTDQYWRFVSAPNAPRFVNGNGFPSATTDRSLLYSVKEELDLGGATLIGNTAYLDRKSSLLHDGTPYVLETLRRPYTLNLGGSQYSSIGLSYKQQVFTQELRLQSNSDADSRLKYVVGVFYQRSRQQAAERDYSVGVASLVFASSSSLLAKVDDLIHDTQIAAFGQIDYRIFENLTATAGIRVSRQKFDFTNASGGAFFGAGSATSGRSAETPVTPKFGLEYKATADWLVYASAAKGFRPGGANPASPATCAADLARLGLTSVPGQYKSDSVWSYEAGIKGRAGRALTLAASVFDIEWKNIQSAQRLPTCAVRYIDNLGAARSRGFDAQLDVRIARGLNLGVSASYTDAKYTQTLLSAPPAPPATAVTIVKKGQALSPKWVVTLSGDYETPLGASGLTGYAHGQYDYRSRYYALAPGVNGYDPIQDQSTETNFVSARIGVRKGPVDVSVFVNNLLNSTDALNYVRTGLVTDRYLEQSFRPRTFGLTAAYRY